ncbi:VOC family protein [Streptomyces sp. VNUA116]|uniref:VOC family protein n=1 Tax=Streptomyces sp. VNUA116 TaxID=3062449 RepID=UPI00267592B0|nr:VOC family protein [Streptomyces sp. VNUA116]WKU48703.1 VOC family protein [Streptomyces sp. VNUA116]
MSAVSSLPAAVGSVASYAFWGPDGRVLADFYAAALGWRVAEEFPGEDGAPTAFLVTDGSTRFIFYTARDFTAPNWPQEELPFHLDLAFEDVPAAERRLLSLGATKPAHQPGGEYWTVLLDPSGQPFCISAGWSEGS